MDMNRLTDSKPAHWNTKDWTMDQWISFHGPILFSIFFNIICLIYFHRFWKVRNHAEIFKHVKIRNFLLFYSHMLVNYYWIAIHPTIIFIFIILGLDTPLLFCFTYFVISIKLLIWCNRMWILYWQYSFSSMQIKMLWRKQIDDKYGNKLLQYPKLGRLSCTMPITASAMFLFDIFLFCIAYYTNFNQTFHVAISIHFFCWVMFLCLLCIRLHRKHNIDNFKIRSEFTWLCILFSFDFGILVTPYFAVANQIIRIWIIIDGLALCNLVMIIITVTLILNNSNTHKNILNNTNIHKISNVIELFQDPTGINAFAEWLVGEFNVESLLFIIEVSQFRTLLRKHIYTTQCTENKFDDSVTYYFEIANNIPLTQIINESVITEEDNDKDTKYNFSQIVQKIYEKYIKFEDSDLCINISYGQRSKLNNITFEDLDIISLYHVLDEVFLEILRVLRDPFSRFTKTDTYKQFISNKSNHENTTNVDDIFQEIKHTIDDRVHLIIFKIAIYLEKICSKFKCCI
eukprot:509564_1